MLKLKEILFLILFISTLQLKLIESEKEDHSVALIDENEYSIDENDLGETTQNAKFYDYITYGQGRNDGHPYIVYSTRRIQEYQKGGLSYKYPIDLRNVISITMDLNIPYTFVRHFFGYSFVLSQSTNPYCSSSTCYLGYESVSKAFALRVDLNFFSWVKIPTPSMCFHKCFTSSCSDSECENINAPTTFQIEYDTPWSGQIKMTYDPDQENLELFLNGQMHKRISINLQNYIGINPTLFWSANGKRNGADLYINKLDIVQTKSLVSLPKIAFIKNDQIVTTPKYDINTNFYVYLQFSSKEYADHIKGYISTPCGKVSGFTTYKSSETERVALISSCLTPGTHTVYYIDPSRGKVSASFTINESEFSRIKYYGHDGIKDEEGYTPKTDDDINIIRFGSMKNKDFKLADFENGSINLNFVALDNYDNVLDLGTTQTVLKNKFKIYIINPYLLFEDYSINRIGNGSTCYYNVKFKVLYSGNYIIKSNAFSSVGDFKLRVYDAYPSMNSYCQITNENRLYLSQGEIIEYKCLLYDNFNELITPEDRQNYYDFEINILIISDNKYQDVPLNETLESFNAYYTTNEGGNFQFIGYYDILIGHLKRKIRINSKIDSFNVLPQTKTLQKAQIYSFSDKTWSTISEVKSLKFDYSNNNQKNIIALNIATSHEKFLSDEGYDHFNKKNIKAYISNEHMLRNEDKYQMKISLGRVDSKQVLLLKILDNRDEVFRRTSFYYYIEIYYNSEKAVIPVSFGPLKNNKIVACQHRLLGDNSYIDNKKQEYQAYVGIKLYLGTLYFQTICNYLYNYEDLSKISYYMIKQNDTVKDGDFNITILPNSTINGANDIYVLFNKQGSYQLSFFVDGRSIKSGDIKFSVKTYPPSYRIEFNSDLNTNYTKNGNIYTYNSVYNADQAPEIYFKVYDEYNNQIVKKSSLENLGLSFKLLKDDVEIADLSNKISFKYKNAVTSQYFKDLNKESGNYQIIITCISNQENYIKVIYNRVPGGISPEKSVINYIGPNRINQDSFTYISVSMLDDYSNKITSNLSTYESEIKKINVYATYDDNKALFEVYSKNGNEITFKNSHFITVPGTYVIKGFVNDVQITNSIVSTFIMKENEYNFFNSLLVMFYEKIERLNPHTYYNIKILKNDPIFYFIFYNKNGDKIIDISNDSDISLELFMTDTSEYITLNSGWVDKSKKYFYFPENIKTNLAGRKAYLTINQDKSKSILLNFLKNNESDYEEDSSIDLSNTLVTNQNLTLTAGEKQTVLIELKTKNGKRNSFYKDIYQNFSYISSNPSQKINVNFYDAPLYGQVIVEISQETANSFSTANIITFKFNDELIENKEIYVIVEPNEFDHFAINEEFLKNKDENIIKDGSTSKKNYISFYPLDKYENKILTFFDKNLYSPEDFHRFFSAKLGDNFPVSLSSITANQSEIEIIFNIKRAGTIEISSIFLKNKYIMNIYANQISAKSNAYFKEDYSNVIAGNSISVIVEPRDEYSNKIEEINESELSNFKMQILKENKEIQLITDCQIDKTNNLIVFDNVILKEKGIITIKIFYDDSEIQIDNDIINVLSSNVDYTKTKLVSNGIEFSPNLDSPIVEISKEVLPKFYLKFYDEFENDIDDSSSIKIESISYNTSENDFCIYDAKSYKIINICPNKVETYVENHNETGENDKFIITFENGNQIFYYVKINAFGTDSALSTEQIAYDKIYINQKSISSEAGKYYEIYLEFRDENGKRTNDLLYKNEDISDNFKFEYSNDHNDNHNHIVIQGEQIGQYIILIKSNKICEINDEETLEISIKDNQGIYHKLSEKIVFMIYSSNIKHCYFMRNNQIISPDNQLPNAKADKAYSLKMQCYDEFDNIGRGIISNVFTVKYSGIQNQQIRTEYTTKLLSDGSIYLTVYPILSGHYLIESPYFIKNSEKYSYNFDSLAGELSPENILIDMESSAIAGNEFYVNIYLKDIYGNKITVNDEYKDEFIVYYKHKLTDEEEQNFDTWSELKNLEFEKVDVENNCLVFKTILEKSGKNVFYGLTKDKKIPLKCKNCFTTVSPSKEYSLSNSHLYIFDYTTTSFKELTDDKFRYYDEQNIDKILYMRLYPSDKYGNILSSTDSVNLISYKINTIDLQIEKKIDYFLLTLFSDEYIKLDGGEHTITIKNDKDEILTRSILLTGDLTKEFYTSQELDISKTKILLSDLQFKAGDYGYMYLQLRTKNNMRYYSSKPTSIEIYDCNNNKLTTKSILQEGIIYVLLSSTYSNSYPYYNQCQLSIKINNEDNYINAHPYIHVTPKTLIMAKISNKYLENDESFNLKNGTSDSELFFEVEGYDKYGNLARFTESDIRLILSKNNIVYETSCVNNILNGYLFYYTYLSSTGKYEITAGKNYEDDNLFNDTYFVNLISGKVDIESTKIKVFDSSIEAGNSASIGISPRDSSDNLIDIKLVSEKFTISIQDGNKIVTPTKSISSDNQYIIFTAELTKSGDHTWQILLKDDDEDTEMPCDDCNVNVFSSYCEPEKTLLYAKDKEGNEHLYTPNSTPHLYSSVSNGFKFELVLKDRYENNIDTINSKDTGDKYVKIEDASLSGNNMEKEIILKSEVNLNEDRFIVQINYDDNDSMDLYKRLVTSDNYILKFNVTTSQNSYEFIYYVNHEGLYTNPPYGNGFYAPEFTTIEDEKLFFRAGEEVTTKFQLKTKENLIYTDNIDDSKIKYSCTSDLLNVTIGSSGIITGEYLVEIKGTKAESSTLTIEIVDPITNSFVKIGQIVINVNVTLPDKSLTTHSPIGKLKIGQIAKIQVTLYDQYNNKYNEYDYNWIVPNLTIINNYQEVSNATIEISSDENLQISFYPIASITEISFFNIFLNYEMNEYFLFEEDVEFTIESEVSFENTKFVDGNLYNIKVGEKLNTTLKFYTKTDVCYQEELVTQFEVYAEVTGPIEGYANCYKYQFEYYIDDTSTCKHGYKLNIKDDNTYTKAGSYTVNIYVIVNSVKTNLKSATQNVMADVLDNIAVISEEDGSTQKVLKVSEILKFSLYGYDQYGNSANQQSISDDIIVTIIDSYNEELSSDNYELTSSEISYGDIQYELKIFKLGTYNLNFKYQDESIKMVISSDLLNIIVNPGECTNDYVDIDFKEWNRCMVGVPVNIYITCHDSKNNLVRNGGASFTSNVLLSITGNDLLSTSKVRSIVKDNEDGTYKITFTPLISGTYSFNLYLNEEKFITEEMTKEIGEDPCESNTTHPYLCPNDLSKCVASLLECIPEEQRGDSIEKPFKCLVDGVLTNVEARVDCDCDVGYEKCSIFGACVKSDKWKEQCPFFTSINCRSIGYSLLYKNCFDGICRKNCNLSPSIRVCPIGTVLCPDLTCRTNISECLEVEECPSSAPYRCLDSSCVSDQANCHSQVSCSDRSNYVCPDGTCVTNEIYCKHLTICTDEAPFLCASNVCAKDRNNCPTPISCGHSYSLCEDQVCRATCS